jgi:Thoeris protein ThsB, TIR-like domain
MGGGGGGRGLTPSELESLADKVKRAVQEAAQPKRRNVFISFVEEDLDDVNLLRGQAKNENSNLDFNDWSVKEPFDSEKAEYIRRGIRERIRQSSVTLVYISDKAASSKWVDWEIQESIALGKGVIAVYKGDSPPANLPPSIVEHKIRLVPWDQKQITAAIEQAAKSA